MIRIVVLAEHAFAARGAARPLGAEEQLEVTEVFGGPAALSSPEAREALAAAQVLLYVSERAVEALPWPELRPAAGQALVILDMTGQLGPERAVALGAHGYIGPDEAEEVWAPRILAAAEGKPAFPPESIAALQARAHQAARAALGIDRLSPAQLNAVRLYARGLPIKQIAQRLDISRQATRDRLARSCALLGAANLQSLAVLAGQAGLHLEETEPESEVG